nr:RNA polymerase beta' subunit [Ostreobium quekettii]
MDYNTFLQSIRLKGIQIRLASPNNIRRWAERKLPNGKIVGQVTSSQTVNYQNDFECSCGKKPSNLQKFCPNCDVEFTYSKKRRYQLGFIKLFNPTAHIWYLKGRPSYLSILLNFNRRQAESLIYCTESILNSVFPTAFNSIFYQPSTSHFNLKYRNLNRFKKTLFIKFFRQPFSKPKILIDHFILQLMNFNFFPVKSYLEAHERKKIHQSTWSSPKNININWSLINEVKKKPFVLFRLKNFLNSSKYWKFERKRSLLLKNYRSQFFKPKKRGKQNFKNSNYTNFANSYYSISKYFCWEESINSAHFIYYMTSLPLKSDEIIVQYKNSTLQHLKKSNIHIGAQIFNILLKALSQKLKGNNLWALERQIRIYLFEITEFSAIGELFERVKLIRRLKLIWYFRRTKNQPSWMILSILPVLPPDLRPIIQLEGNQTAISDLNKLYQKVLFRNRRIQKLKIGHYSNTSEEMQYAQRLLQEAVDCLIENGKGGTSPSSTLNNRPLKSLSDILKGKKGRFRQNLLGKRVDYSGRSVIVVGPHLKIHECGIPKEMALELFQPFLIRALVFQKKARTILGAKRLIEKGGDIIYQLLYEIIKNYPVLLNRAPTLHRLSIQSFQPRLVEGRAIILHPLVCSSFNADFDGDQMAVHIPLSYQARSEAWKLLWSQNNLLSPATGQPTLMPTQDMVLGWYYLTAFDPKNFYTTLLKSIEKPLTISTTKKLFQIKKIPNFYRFKRFKNKLTVFLAYNQKKINIHTPIWVFWQNLFEIEPKNQQLFEMQLSSKGQLFLLSSQFLFSYNWYGLKTSQFILTTAGRVILNDFVK